MLWIHGAYRMTGNFSNVEKVLERLEATAVNHHGSLRNALTSFHGYYAVRLGSTRLLSIAAKFGPFMIQVFCIVDYYTYLRYAPALYECTKDTR